MAGFINNYPNPVCRLIQDNDAKHNSEICQAALVRNNIRWVTKLMFFN